MSDMVKKIVFREDNDIEDIVLGQETEEGNKVYVIVDNGPSVKVFIRVDGSPNVCREYQKGQVKYLEYYM